VWKSYLVLKNGIWFFFDVFCDEKMCAGDWHSRLLWMKEKALKRKKEKWLSGFEDLKSKATS